MDVLSASGDDDTIAWYENDGSESFTVHTITTAADGANSVFATDVDGDGDMDVLSASGNDDTIAWYENDGSESFTAHTISTAANGANSVFAADVDGDGDMDVLSASGDDDTIAWYENAPCVVDIEDLYNFASQWLLSGDVEGNFDWGDNPSPENGVDLLDYSYLASYWLDWCPEDWPWP